MSCRAAVQLLTCLLALVTAMALLGAAATVGRPSILAPSGRSTETVVRAFYDAIDETLRAGDTAALESVVDPGLVAHDLPPSVTPDRAGLIHYLASVHAVFSDREVVVEEVVAAGDRAMVRLVERGAQSGSFLGLRLAESGPAWGQFNAVRATAGRVVELWASAEKSTLLELIQTAPLDSSTPANRAVALERITFSVEDDQSHPLVSGARAIYVESGTIIVELDPSATQRASMTLDAGDALALPPASVPVLRHDHGRSAAVLVVVEIPAAVYTGPLRPNGASEATPDDRDGSTVADVRLEPLVGDPTVPFPDGAAELAIGRVTISPGTAIDVNEASGPVLLCVTAGALSLEPGVGTAAVPAASGLLIPPGDDFELRASGGEFAVVVILTILPDDMTGRVGQSAAR